MAHHAYNREDTVSYNEMEHRTEVLAAVSGERTRQEMLWGQDVDPQNTMSD